VQLEESERAASRQAKLCSARLHYLEGVDQLAQQSKAGSVDVERMDDEAESGAEALASGSSLSQQSPSPPPRKSRTARNVQEDMDVDASSAAAAAPASLSLSAGASVQPASKAAPAETDDALATSFVVTPQLRLDRIFAEHLLRNSQ
jgi:hypothetical protein